MEKTPAQGSKDVTDAELAELEQKFAVLKFFKYKHLPEELQEFSRPLGILAARFAKALRDSPHPAEVAVGLRKLKEAKDAFVCSRLPASGEPIRRK